MTSLARLAALWTVSSAALLACPICFDGQDQTAVTGVLPAVFVLVGATLVVLSACGAFAVRLARRSRAGEGSAPSSR